jgi:hypothetical protein
MAGERLVRILARLAPVAAGHQSSAHLCEVAAEVVAMTGASIMLMSKEAARVSLCASNDVSARIEDLQFALGEGPSIDAFHENRPVLEPDLADPEHARWISFAPPAVQAGARAVFGFPVQVGVVRMGSLNLYRDIPGKLTHDQHADSLVMAEVAARAVVAMQSRADPGAVAIELEAGANFRFVVHQASGMVSAQLGANVGDALIRMRAYAFANNRSLEEIAEDVVDLRLRFDAGFDSTPGA